jgi:hypothetical protein
MVVGTGFVSGASVEIGQGNGAGPSAIVATNVVVVSGTEITATTGGPRSGRNLEPVRHLFGGDQSR